MADYKSIKEINEGINFDNISNIAYGSLFALGLVIATMKKAEYWKSFYEQLCANKNIMAKSPNNIQETSLGFKDVFINSSLAHKDVINQPSNLVATLQFDGSVALNWNCNGNSSQTQYVVECKDEKDVNWTVLDVITKTSYIHKIANHNKGLRYIIKARRDGKISYPSNIASIQ